MILSGLWPRIKATLRALATSSLPADPSFEEATRPSMLLRPESPRPAPAATPAAPTEPAAPVAAPPPSAIVPYPAVVPYEGLEAHLREPDDWRFDAQAGRLVKRALVDVTLVDGRRSRLLVVAHYDAEGGLAMEFVPVIPLRTGSPARALVGDTLPNDEGRYV